jgi:hypothetical protein
VDEVQIVRLRLAISISQHSSAESQENGISSFSINPLEDLVWSSHRT